MEEEREMEVKVEERESGISGTVEEEKEGLDFPYWSVIRRKYDPDAPFFASGNIERELLSKQVALDLTQDEEYELSNMADAEHGKICCPIAGCGAQLISLEDFEDHYLSRHSASCSVCSRVYPTSRLLNIHISEAHDSFFQAKVARGYAMYECLVEGCGAKMTSYKSRHQHLVDKHKFPDSFEFLKKHHPSKRQRQRRQACSKKGAVDQKMRGVREEHQKREEREDDQKGIEERKGMDVDGTIEDLVSKVSKLSTADSTPSVVSFGRRHTRGLAFVPRNLQREKKQDLLTNKKG
ncbi:zinc finger protein 511 [Amborella trichopoda]|nr:zinc finger protein 511 [Amborella trichopoda]|eukprot:XP_006848252.2 zinc finger protein 511 [Amborella trichopoda]